MARGGETLEPMCERAARAACRSRFAASAMDWTAASARACDAALAARRRAARAQCRRVPSSRAAPRRRRRRCVAWSFRCATGPCTLTLGIPVPRSRTRPLAVATPAVSR